MDSNVSYQLKTDFYKYRLLFVSLMVTTQINDIVDTQKVKRKESQLTTTENHHVLNEESKKRRNKGPVKEQKTVNKMATSTTHQ